MAVGDVVGIVPNHVCQLVNLADRWYGVRDGVLEREFAVIGGGRVA
jgi:D-serine deaminase-like pyridoxal phosphate-dependent protein